MDVYTKESIIGFAEVSAKGFVKQVKKTAINKDDFDLTLAIKTNDEGSVKIQFLVDGVLTRETTINK